MLPTFLLPTGNRAPTVPSNAYRIKTKIINMVGCGTGTSGTAVFGNGATAVPVRLDSSQ